MSVISFKVKINIAILIIIHTENIYFLKTDACLLFSYASHCLASNNLETLGHLAHLNRI